jgi:hypothetical protein
VVSCIKKKKYTQSSVRNSGLRVKCRPTYHQMFSGKREALSVSHKVDLGVLHRNSSVKVTVFLSLYIFVFLFDLFFKAHGFSHAVG